MLIKQEILDRLIAELNKKANALNDSVREIKESRNSDTKSSAGDKFETGREMMQVELDKNEAQLSKTRMLVRELEKIDVDKKYTIVEFGSLVFTSNGNYFISIGLGKVVIQNEVCFAISLNSPIGKKLRGKKAGESFQFQGKEVKVLGIS